ncbi:ABC transporter substrate-binding protein [Nocardiopsis mangrovi]|uniref:ABC transporter substrate-binding protein n=1 Tax=Nocardiopsis mangrovi TaxID=1179818 RepID=A0ABV9E1B5_9ACTN
MLATGLTATACGAPGGAEQTGPYQLSAEETVNEPFTAEQVAELGDITLRVWADQNEQGTLEELIPAYEETYPNVTVEPTYKSYDDLMSTVVPALQAGGGDAPDLVQGNQGYSVDGALVQGGLIRPMDDLAEAYGWTDGVSPSFLASMSWDETGMRFGQGTLYGISPVSQLVSVFYNKDILSAAGVEPPETFEDLEAALEAVQERGEQPLILGNAEQYPAFQLFGVIQGAYSEPLGLTEWISGTSGSDFVNEGNLQAADKLVEWAEAGYIQDGYNGLAEADAVTSFAEGDGAFLIGGDWNAEALVAAEADNVGFLPPPTGESGGHVTQGGSGLPWHINAETESLPAAAAFLAMQQDAEFAQTLADLGRIPATSPDVEGATPLAQETIDAANALMADDGQIGYLDWATDSMYDTLAAETQELLDGRKSTDEFLSNVQTDWRQFQAEHNEQGAESGSDG